MTPRSVYNLRGGHSGGEYATLMVAVAPLATSFGLIVRSNLVRLSDKATDVLHSLEPMVMSVEEVAKWPGTELIGGRRSVRYSYRLEPASIDILIASASSLFDWVNPGLPEDLHLIRSDGSTVLGTVAQEGDAWLELNDQEVVQLLAASATWLQTALDNVD
jgi:hypothetical protein